MSGHGFIAAAARTPIGSFQGSLAALTAPALGAHAIRAVLSGIDPAGIDEVIFGNVISAGLKQAPARQAMRLAGLPDACGATTIDKVCGSGMKAVMLAHDLIRAGSANAVICGGMESMTNAPYLLMRARSGLRTGHGELKDAMFRDGLEDADTGASMGSFAEATASARQISREAMDAYALESVLRARRAIEQRSLAGEISPVSINGTLVTDDEQPGRARPEKIPALKPAFKANGAITAANSSSISDGASALLVTLAHGLIRTGGKRGIASLCIGGGEATAVALERV